jgi:hypothetical protein
VTRAPSASSPERATLSRDLADFLIELSIALHKHAMYPEGHPSLAPAAAALTRRAGLLLEDRPSLALGVARHQLVIEGIATDPKHPVLAELAGRLHRHHLGAVTFRRGIAAAEVGDALRTLALDAERSGQPLGLGPPERLRAWPHLQLHALTFERLELVAAEEAGAERGARAAQLWVGLARAAISSQPDDERPAPTEPIAIAQAIDQHSQTDAAAYDQVIVGYLLQIAEELKTAGSDEAVALRRHTSRLIRALHPDTLARLVAMGGDFAQRRQFVSDAADALAVDAVLEIVKAAAQTSHQTISHALVRLLAKLAAHAEAGAATVQPQADAALREQIQQLLGGWSLPNPTPGDYGVALERMSRTAPAPQAAEPPGQPCEPERIVALGLELDSLGPPVFEAVDRLEREGGLARLLDVLDALAAPSEGAATIAARVATVDAVTRLVASEPVDFKLLERLTARVGLSAAAPLLDALATAQARGTRRGLLAQLVRLGPAIGPLVVARLGDERWFVVRNLLALLDELPALPEGFSPARYTRHDDARVRWQAVKLQLRLPAERNAALVGALRDADARLVRLGLTMARERCPDAAVPLLVARVTDRGLTTDLRVLAIRALGATGAPAALEALLRVTAGGRTLFGRDKLAEKSPELLVALTALATGWSREPRARAALARAAASSDREIRAATDPPGRP